MAKRIFWKTWSLLFSSLMLAGAQIGGQAKTVQAANPVALSQPRIKESEKPALFLEQFPSQNSQVILAGHSSHSSHASHASHTSHYSGSTADSGSSNTPPPTSTNIESSPSSAPSSSFQNSPAPANTATELSKSDSDHPLLPYVLSLILAFLIPSPISWLARRKLKAENRSLQEQLHRQTEVETEGMRQLKQENNTLKQMNENLNVTIQTLRNKPAQSEGVADADRAVGGRAHEAYCTTKEKTKQAAASAVKTTQRGLDGIRKTTKKIGSIFSRKIG